MCYSTSSCSALQCQNPHSNLFVAVSSAVDLPSRVVASGIISWREQKNRELKMPRHSVLLSSTDLRGSQHMVGYGGLSPAPDPDVCQQNVVRARCAPTEHCQGQMCTLRMYPYPDVHLQNIARARCALAKAIPNPGCSNCLQIAARPMTCKAAFAAERDVSKFLSSSPNVFPEGPAKV